MIKSELKLYEIPEKVKAGYSVSKDQLIKFAKKFSDQEIKEKIKRDQRKKIEADQVFYEKFGF